MVSMTIKRRLGAWLIGLYVLALFGGITPLMDSDSAHAGAPITFSASKGAMPVQNHHHAGDAADAAQHHALQDLTGVLTWLPDGGEFPVIHVVITPGVPQALAEADTLRLDRPPKQLLSI